MNPEGLSTLVRYATGGIEARTQSQQVEIYEALSLVLPSKEDRVAAARVAFAIQETAKLQLDFGKHLETDAVPAAPQPTLSPCENAKRLLLAKGWNYRTAAPKLGVCYQHLSDVLNGKRDSRRLLEAITALEDAQPTQPAHS